MLRTSSGGGQSSRFGRAVVGFGDEAVVDGVVVEAARGDDEVFTGTALGACIASVGDVGADAFDSGLISAACPVVPAKHLLGIRFACAGPGSMLVPMLVGLGTAVLGLR